MPLLKAHIEPPSAPRPPTSLQPLPNPASFQLPHISLSRPRGRGLGARLWAGGLDSTHLHSTRTGNTDQFCVTLPRSESQLNSKDSAWPGGCQGRLTPGFSYPSEWFGGSGSLSNLNVRHLEGRDPIISCFLGQRLGLMQDSVPGFRGCPLTPGQHPQGCRLEQSFSPSLHTGTWAQRS